MALLVTGNFYTATFYATTNGAWAALGSPPNGISGTLAAAIYVAAPTAITFYVVDSGTGAIAFEGGQAFGFDDTLINPPGSATLLTGYILDAVDTSQTFWADDGAGDLLQYDATTGLLRRYTGAEIGGFKAFIAAV